MRRTKERCGAQMQDGKVCGRILDHTGNHTSEDAYARTKAHLEERTAKLRAVESVCARKGCENTAPVGYTLCLQCSVKHSAASEKRLVAEFFEIYGDHCACCGVTEDLSLDHVQGDGKEHRASLSFYADHAVRMAIYRSAVAVYDPLRYQVLCCRCNKSKRQGDYCRLDHALMAS